MNDNGYIGNIAEGEYKQEKKGLSTSKMLLNIKTSRTVRALADKLNTNYIDECCVIISNLLTSKKVSYSRDSSITEPKKYNKKGISNYKIMRAIDCLVNLGLVDNYISKQSFNNDYLKELSHIEPTQLFIDMFASPENIKYSKQSLVKDRQPVILKDKEGNKIEYKDSPYTKALRDQLTEYNVFASGFLVECKDSIMSTSLDAHHKHSFTEYGRLFGASYQTIPKGDRTMLTIDGRTTIEMDYSNMHFRMLLDMYLLSDYVKDDDDLYSLPLSLEQQKNPNNRTMIKLMFNMMINCTSKQKAIQALQGKINKDFLSMGSFDSVASIYKSLELAFPFIFENKAVMANIYSGKPLASLLQNREVAITKDIISTCRAIDMLVMPIHDSYATEVGHNLLLMKIMGDAYRKEMRTSKKVNIKVILGSEEWKEAV
jgi:hypothetical protein